jgi:hypothetical protein
VGTDFKYEEIIDQGRDHHHTVAKSQRQPTYQKHPKLGLHLQQEQDRGQNPASKYLLPSQLFRLRHGLQQSTKINLSLRRYSLLQLSLRRHQTLLLQVLRRKMVLNQTRISVQPHSSLRPYSDRLPERFNSLRWGLRIQRKT